MIRMEDIYPLIIEAFNSGNAFTFPIHGTSMRPLLKTGDTVTLVKINDKPKKGDMVLYRRDDKAFVLHRIIKVHDDTFDFVGDHQVNIEKNVRADMLIGLVVSYKKKDKEGEHHLNGFRYAIYKKMVKFRLFRRMFMHLS